MTSEDEPFLGVLWNKLNLGFRHSYMPFCALSQERSTDLEEMKYISEPLFRCIFLSYEVRKLWRELRVGGRKLLV